MSKLSFRARALDASKPMPIYLAEELPDLPDYSAINRAVPQMPSGMEKEEESEHHLQRAISGTGLIIPTPEVCEVNDIIFYEKCYPPDYKMPKQHIHMQPLWEEQEAPEYDIDSEDERWLKQQRHPELTEWKFEQMMDKLERSSGQTVVTLNEAKLLLERHDDLVTAVYDYWLNKRLTTQHPLILSVKTESRPGQSTNNPYLAFRRRTEKMQTRKNRKNDESSYEKMLKLRRELARALSLLELVARREVAKRELVRLTARLADRRHRARDYSAALPDPPRTTFASVVPAGGFRAYSAPHAHHAHHAPPDAHDVPRLREKRPYKRRKFRHNVGISAHAMREAAGSVGGATSSEEECRTEPAPDDGPFAFRRKPGCYYQMPTSTLSGDPLDSDKASSDIIYEHEIDTRHRYTLTSVNHPYPHCIGFARRRLGRGGRVLLDRRLTPLQDLWEKLPEPPDNQQQDEIENKLHRIPKVITLDYHTSGKYPWRHAFRKHLAKNPQLWIDETDLKSTIKPDYTIKSETDHLKSEMDVCGNDEVTYFNDAEVKSDVIKSANSDYRTLDSNVRDNLQRVMRKRALSCCSDDSYESDESLQPVEQMFEGFIDEVNKKWLHFRPKPPTPSPPHPEVPDDDLIPISLDTPITVEVNSELPSKGLDTFTTSEFTLSDLYGDINPEEKESSAGSLDVSGEDLMGENFTGLTEAQVESILSDTDLKALADVDLIKDDKKITDDLIELVNDEKDSFLLQGQDTGTRAWPGARRRPLGSSRVRLWARRAHPLAAQQVESVETQPVPTSKIIVEEVNEVPHIKIEKRRKEEIIEEVQITSGVQLKTVHTKNSPVKKHIITSTPPTVVAPPTVVTPPTIVTPPTTVTPPTVVATPSVTNAIPTSNPTPTTTSTPASTQPSQPQIVTVAVSDSLKVRLQNHLLSSQAGVLLQNGPQADGGAGRRGTPLVLAHKPPLVVGAGGPAARLKLLQHGQRVLQLAAPAATLLASQLAKGPHLVNVVRQPGGAGVSRVELAARRPLLALPHPRPALSVQHLLRPAHQIQLKSRTLQVSPGTGGAPTAVVANLLHKAPLPHATHKRTIGGAPLAANVQAIAFSAAQLRPRHPPRPANNEIVVEGPGGAGNATGDAEDEAVRRRDSLPMEVT